MVMKNTIDQNVSNETVNEMVKQYRSGSTLTQVSVRNKLGVALVRRLLADSEGEDFIRGKGASVVEDDRSETMAELYRSGETLQSIGTRYDLSRERVRQILRTNNVKSLGRREQKVPEKLTSTEKKIAKAYDNGTRPADIISKFDISYAEMRKIMRRAGIETKPKGFFNRRPGYDKIRKGVISDYQSGLGTGVIVSKYGLCDKTEIYKFIEREGIVPRQKKKKKKT